MKFILLQKLVTYLLAGLGLLSLSFGRELGLGSIALLLSAYLCTWLVPRSLVARPWWSKANTAVLMLLLGLFTLRGLTGHAGWLGLAMEFSGWLTVSRLANRRTAADYQQVAILAFIQMIAATVLTTDVSYAALFVAFVVATPWVLALSHLRAEIERNYPVRPVSDKVADLERVLSSRRIVGPGFLLWTALLSVPMLLFTVVLFAVFPRVGLGFINLGDQRGQDVVGFGNDVELGGFGLIRDDPTVVLRVNAGRRLSPAQENRVLRLRGTAFDFYDGRRWTRSDDASVAMAPIRGYYALRRMQTRSDLVLKIGLERLSETVVFLPAGTVGVSMAARGRQHMAREQVRLRRGHGLDIRYASNNELGLLYEAAVSLRPGEADVPVARDMDDDRYLQLPEGHERVTELARELTAGVDEPLLAAQLLESHLRDRGRYRYSLMQPQTGNRAPLDVFLFEARRGHCEYFATALAIMLRAVGIPSRNVTGFLGGKYNAYGGYYAVRQSDAHSWVEALIPGRGWVTFDPTPPAHVDARPRSTALDELRSMFDALRAYWMMRVVGYDLRTQLRAVSSMRRFWEQLSFGGERGGDRSTGDRKSGESAWDHLPADLTPWALGLVATLAVAWLSLRALRRRRRAIQPGSVRRAQALYADLERALVRAGQGREQHVTPEAHLRTLERRGFRALEVVRDVTEAYVSARYGEKPLSREQARTLRRRIEEVKKAA